MSEDMDFNTQHQPDKNNRNQDGKTERKRTYYDIGEKRAERRPVHKPPKKKKR